MSRSTKILLIIGGIIALLLIDGCNRYNGFIKSDEEVKEAAAKVQSAYQRRLDLIPNLVETVKGAADFEKSTLEAVVNARANATKVTINTGDLTEENIRAFQKAQDALSSSLSRLLAVAEAYPQLRATENFSMLQKQLEGTEDRIKVARDDYNAAVRGYNTRIRRFPSNIYAGMFGFHPKGMFEATPGAENAPKVDFKK